MNYELALGLHNLRRQGHNLQKLLLAQFAGYGSENARAHRLVIVLITTAAFSSKRM